MKSFFSSRIKKWCAFLAITSFFAVAVFSVGVGMSMDDMGNMIPCAFMMGETAICPMGVSQHINEWKELFVPITKLFSLFFAPLAAVFFAVTAFKDFFAREQLRQKRKRIYAQYSFHMESLFFLLRAFSRGILHPRLYAFASI
jgi:hypothetical protein